MITVGVRFFGHLRRYAAHGCERSITRVTVAPGTTLSGLLQHLGIPADDQSDGIVNWEVVEPGYALRDGDEGLILPALMGGAGPLGRGFGGVPRVPPCPGAGRRQSRESLLILREMEEKCHPDIPASCCESI